MTERSDVIGERAVFGGIVPTGDGGPATTAEESQVVSSSGSGPTQDEPSDREIVVEDGVATSRSKRSASGQSRGVPDGKPCETCRAPLSAIRINVDGRTLLMESCDGCDTRRWQLAGEQIDLQEALNQVGEHAGRRRSDV